MKRLMILGLDEWSRIVCEDTETGIRYVMVDDKLHTMTSEGEPISPVKFDYELFK